MRSLGKCYVTNEERKNDQRKAWYLDSRLGGSAIFITMLPSERGSILLTYFAGKCDESMLDNKDFNNFP